MSVHELRAGTALARVPERIVRIRAWPDAFGGEPVDFEVPWGATIAEIVEKIPLRPEHEVRRQHFQVFLGEHRVPRENWRLVRPSVFAERCPVAVTIRLPLHGGMGGRGGGGRKILMIVAAIALFAVTAWIGGGGLGFLGSAFKAGTWGAKIAAGIVGVAGAMLLQGLLKPPEPPKQDGVDAIGFASAQNDFAPGSYLPRPLGKTRLAPPMVCPPFTTIDNGVLRDDDTYRYSQYATAVFGIAGQTVIHQILMNGIDIDTEQDVEVETRLGTPSDAPLTMVTDTRIEESMQLQLSGWETDEDDDKEGYIQLDGTVEEAEPLWHRIETGREPDHYRIEFLFPRGLVYIDTSSDEGQPNKAAAVTFRIRMRQRENGAWTDWVNLPELMARAKEPNNAVRLHLEVHWVDEYPEEAGNAWPPVAEPYNKIKGWADLWSHDAWESDLVTSVGSHRYAQWYWESDKRIKLFLLKNEFPKGKYQFEIKKSWSIRMQEYDSTLRQWSREGYTTTDFFTPFTSTGSGEDDFPAGTKFLSLRPADFAEDVAITSVQSVWDEAPIVSDGEAVTLIAVRVKARELGRIEVICSGVCEDWTGSEWVADQTPSNPASLYRHVLLEAAHNAEPIPEALADMARLQDWWQFCKEHDLACNTSVRGKSVTEVLQTIAQAGWASPTFGATYSVVIDRVREDGPVGMITQRNAGRFSFSKPFADRPHALRVTFRDETDDYKPKEVIVYAPGYGAASGGGLTEATRFETVVYEGITTEGAAVDRAVLDIAWSIHRSTLHNFSMDLEHLEFTRGDLVMMETDILGQHGGRGYIKTITMDGDFIESITIDEDAWYGPADPDADSPTGTPAVMIRGKTGELYTHAVDNPGADRTLIVFPTPISMPTEIIEGDIVPLIAVGGLVTTGSLATVSREVLMWDVQPGPDLTANITAIDYAADDVYAAFTGDLLDVGDGFILGAGDGYELAIS